MFIYKKNLDLNEIIFNRKMQRSMLFLIYLFSQYNFHIYIAEFKVNIKLNSKNIKVFVEFLVKHFECFRKTKFYKFIYFWFFTNSQNWIIININVYLSIMLSFVECRFDKNSLIKNYVNSFSEVIYFHGLHFIKIVYINV